MDVPKVNHVEIETRYNQTLISEKIIDLLIKIEFTVFIGYSLLKGVTLLSIRDHAGYYQLNIVYG